MNGISRWPFAISIGAFLALTTLLPTPARGQDRPDFSGHWVLAPDESDDPRQKLMRSGVSIGPDPVAQPREDPGVRPGGVNQLPDPEDLRSARASVRSVLAPVEAYHISQARDSIAFVPVLADDSLITLPLDGKTIQRTTSLGPMEIKAEWDGSRIRIERKYQDGPTVKERYALGLGGVKLLVDYSVDADGLPGGFAFRRVYRRGEPGGSTPAASPPDSVSN